MFSCLQILEAFLWFVLITLLNVTLIILTLSVSRLLNLLLRLVAFLLFLNPQCWASISRWITASSSWKRCCLFVCRALSSDRKSGSAGMPRPISYAVFCLKKKRKNCNDLRRYRVDDVRRHIAKSRFDDISLTAHPVNE